MAKNNGNKDQGKILPFRQDIDFFLKQGEKQLDNNDLLTAIQRYRQAYDSDPTDLDSCLSLADVLSRMQRYEESNRLLLVDMSMNDPDPEHYFGLATNYYGMQEFEYARESLETYLTLEPDGYYALDAQDFLDVLDDEEELAFQIGSADDETPETLTVCARARQAVACGCPEIALELVREHLKLVPDSVRARNQLALVQYCMGSYDQAEMTLDGILRMDGNDIQALSTKYVLATTQGKHEDADRILAKLSAIPCEDPEELSAQALAMLQGGRYKDAITSLESLRDYLPYDPLTLHRLACCHQKTGEQKKAEDCYLTLLKINPADTVAQYFLRTLRQGIRHDDKMTPLQYEVPIQEMVSRFHEISSFSLLEKREQLKKWKEEKHIRELVAWGLNSQNRNLKPRLLQLLGSLHDFVAEQILRDFLLRTDQNDNDKREAVGILHKMHARDLYMAFIEGHWVQGQLSQVLLPDELPKLYQHLLNGLNGNAIGSCTDACIGAIAYIIRYLMESKALFGVNLSKQQQQALIAAIEWKAHSFSGESFTKQEIAGKYGVTSRRLEFALKRLGDVPSPKEE